MSTPPSRSTSWLLFSPALSLLLLSVMFLVVQPINAFSATRTILRPIVHKTTTKPGRFRSPFSLHSSSLEDPEEDPEIAEETLVVSKEPFEAEAEVSDRANAMLSDQGNSDIELKNELEASFLQYALSIILGRALPDARDGLKPVHRRILFAMNQLNLYPTSSHRKCARVVGEVLGKYHPHGDMSVYDALVRMAQDFSTAYLLVDGHGNFGSVDADPAAAMRYTECRLTAMARETLMGELDFDTVDFTPNFDGNEDEPTVLPSKLPLLLLNGSSGIAVGMATNIPPHNLREITMACRALIEEERIGAAEKGGVSDEELFEMVPGPDFPTGATIMGTDDSRKLHETGNGRVLMRAVTHLEEVPGKKNRMAIVVTELPYQVNKAALLEQIANLVNDKKIEGISDLRDESDRDGIRIVLELKQRDTIPEIVLANLYKKTRLQHSFNGNMLALMKPESTGIESADTGALTPQRFTLREALDYFLDFRFETIRRKTNHQLGKVQSRIHVVDGLLLALNQIDAIIELVRKMPDQDSCRTVLMQSEATSTSELALGLSKIQANSVLRLQLGQMTRLNQNKLTEERDELESKRKGFQKLLDEDDAVYETMSEELEEMDQKYGTERKSKILKDDDGEVQEVDLVKNSRSVIVITRGGYIKRMELKTFTTQRRGTMGKMGSSVDDEVLHCVTCNDHDTLLMFTQTGFAFGLRAYQVPTGSRRAKGTPLPSVVPIKIGQSMTAVLAVTEFTKDEYLVLATKQGIIKKTPLDSFEKITGSGLRAATLAEGDQLEWCHRCTDGDNILIGTSLGMAAQFDASKLRPTGRGSKGVRAIKLKAGDMVADMNVLGGSGGDKQEFVLCMTEQGYGKRISTDEFSVNARGGVGVIAMKFKKMLEGKDRVSCFCVVNEDDEIMIITSKGVMGRQRVNDIPAQSRTATGARVQKLQDSDMITSVSLVPTRVEV